MSRQIDVDELMTRYGTTYAEQAGITLRDKPAPLYQLLVLTTLSSIRISADIAAAAAKELFSSGWRTPAKMRGSTWQERVDALGRGSYRRYDESTATTLEESAAFLMEEYAGDLRRIRPEGNPDVGGLEAALQRFPRIGPTGAAIFCRAVQAVWPAVRPYFDKRALRSAKSLGYPTDPSRLGELVSSGKIAALSSALVRVSLDGPSPG
jgi:hypothetical protein